MMAHQSLVDRKSKMSKMSKMLVFLVVCVFLGVGAAPNEAVNSKSIYTTIQGFIQGLYREFTIRQQSIANLLACGNCVNEGWDAIMAAAANIPGLEWTHKHQSDGRPPNFFTAINQDGVVTGFGGSIIDNRPVVEFVFDHTGIIQHLNSTKPDILKQ